MSTDEAVGLGAPVRAGAPTPMRAAPGITISGASKRFFHKGLPVQALRKVDLDIPGGEFISLIGPSGCGKSTLLRIIGGLVAPDAGSVRIGEMSADEARVAKLFGLVPQAPCLLPWRSVMENVTLLRDLGRSGRRRGRSGEVAPAGRNPVELLEKVGLRAFANSLPKELSGGMQQRVSLVRAFALGVPILLMDEPFAALDEITRNAMRYQLLEIWAETNTTVVFVTHSIAEAVILSDRVVTMAARPGRVAAVEHISLPRPRTEEMEFTEAFTEHAHNVRSALRDGWAS